MLHDHELKTLRSILKGTAEFCHYRSKASFLYNQKQWLPENGVFRLEFSFFTWRSKLQKEQQD